MPRRIAALILLLTLTGEARAHRLEGQLFVRPFGFIQVESWYETGDTPKAAKVEVFGPDGAKLLEGRLDAAGAFVFPYKGSGPLRVRVNAGAGHLATMNLTPAELGSAAFCAWVAAVTPSPSPFLGAALLNEPEVPTPTPAPLATVHETGPQYGKLLVGVAFLLAVAGAARLLRRRRPAAVAKTPPIH